MRAFTLNEMENAFEIGREIQTLADRGFLKNYDRKEAFMDALIFAIAFEKEYADTDDYHWDIAVFTVKKLQEKGLL